MAKTPRRACLILTRDPFCEALVEITIEQFAFKARHAHSLDELEALSSTTPTVAWFVDLDELPVGAVDKVVERAAIKAPDAKLVFLSSRFTRELATRCLQAQAIALLVKPLVISRLVQTFHQLWQEPELIDREDPEEVDATEDGARSGPTRSSPPDGGGGSAHDLAATVIRPVTVPTSGRRASGCSTAPAPLGSVTVRAVPSAPVTVRGPIATPTSAGGGAGPVAGEADAAPAGGPSPAVINELLRPIDLECPICHTRFSSLRFKLWRFPVTDLDTDFCPLAQCEMHPELYSILVCPGCFFSWLAGRFKTSRFPDAPRNRFLQATAIEERRKVSFGLDFSGVRTLVHGIKSFELGAMVARQLEVKNWPKMAAECYLKSSWLCRRLGHQRQEQDMQRAALDLLLKQYRPYLMEGGRFPGEAAIYAKLGPGMERLGDRAIAVTCFLIADLSRRLGLVEQATRYFAEVTQLPFLPQFTSLMRHVHYVARIFKEQQEKPGPPAAG